MSKTEDFPPNRDFLGLLLPRPAEHKARRGGNYLPDNFFQVLCSFFQVLCNFFYLPDCFSQVLISLAEAAGGLFPKVKYVKVEALGTPIFRGERTGGRPVGGGDAPGCRREVPAGRTKEDRGEDERGPRGQQKSRRGRRKRARGQRKGQREQRKSRQVRAKRSAGRTKESAGRTKETARGQRKGPRGQRKSREAAGIKPIGTPEALIFR